MGRYAFSETVYYVMIYISFLTFFGVLKTLIGVMTIFFIVKVLNMGNIFFFSLDTINTYCKGVMVVTMFLSTMILKISLMVLVFFAGLVLMGRRLLRVLLTRCISKRSVNGLILPKIFLLFFYRLIP